MPLMMAFLTMLSACRTSQVGITPLPSSPPYTEVRLRVGQPDVSGVGFVLWSVDENLKTVILLASGNALSGKPGNYFEVPNHGCSCPRLVSASHETGEATFRWTRY
jgi:hypothetical protein